MSEKTCVCVVNSAHGQYAPQVFMELASISSKGWHISDEDCQTLLKGPDDELYWETWERVLTTAYFNGFDDHKWTLQHNEGVFVVRDDHVVDCA